MVGEDTNNVSPARPADELGGRQAQAEQCFTDLRFLIEVLDPIEEQARNSGDTEHAACLTSGLERLKGLLAIIERAREVIESSQPEDEVARIEAELEKIEIACRRAVELGRDIENCESHPEGLKVRNPAAEQPPPAKFAPTWVPRSAPPPPPWLHRPGNRGRTPRTCLKRGALACLLVRASGLAEESPAEPAACLAVLEREAILTGEPWDAESCASLDDLAIAAARLLGLPVKEPADGLACLDALRAHGLAVDIDLPRRVADAEPPWLLEAEVRSFLVHGLAAPLPSTRPVMPY